GVLGEFGQAPVLLHLGVQEVLVDRGELAGQLFVEQRDDLVVATHGVLASSAVKRQQNLPRTLTPRMGDKRFRIAFAQVRRTSSQGGLASGRRRQPGDFRRRVGGGQED